MSPRPIKIRARGVGMTFRGDGRETKVLEAIDLDVHEGELVCVLGPSGCGKSTFLNIVAGFLEASSGTVTIDDQPVRGPDARRIFVFQERGVFPWLTVAGNIAFGLSRLPEAQRAERVARYVKMVGLGGFEDAYPAELSGGMKQRVEVARALAVDPDVLYLDEPFGALDSITRLDMRRELLRIWEAEKKTILFVTHDIDESVQLADRIVVMGARGSGGVRAIVDVDIPHPRDLSSPRYLAIRDGILQAIGLAHGVLPMRDVTPSRHRIESIALPALTAVAIVCIWSLAVKLSGTKIFPSPRAVLLGIAELHRKGVLFAYTRDSLFRVAGGYLLGVGLGVPLGFFLGLNQAAARAINPLLQVMRPISPLAWIPIAIVLFGIGNEAALFLVFLAAFFPIVLASASALAAVPPIYLRAGRNFGLSPGALFVRVLLPAALPQILIGLRIALGVSWLVVVAAEMIAVDSGLGYLIIDARNAGKRYDLVVAGILLIGLVGLVLDLSIRRLETLRAVRWGFRD